MLLHDQAAVHTKFLRDIADAQSASEWGEVIPND